MRDTAEIRIILDPAILDGKPVVRGTRLSDAHIIGLMAEGWSEAKILADYPGLVHEDLAACLAYAHDAAGGRTAEIVVDDPDLGSAHLNRDRSKPMMW